MVEQFCCLPEATTTFLVSYTTIQNKSQKTKTKKKVLCVDEWKKKYIPSLPLAIGSTYISLNSQIVFILKKINNH